MPTKTVSVHTLARYYEPTSGRFLSADPMGQAASPSLYDFAGGDPVNFFDPTGRCQQNLQNPIYLNQIMGYRAPDGSWISLVNGQPPDPLDAIRLAPTIADTWKNIDNEHDAMLYMEFGNFMSKENAEAFYDQMVLSVVGAIAGGAVDAAGTMVFGAGGITAAETNELFPGSELQANENAGGHTLDLHVGQDASSLFSRALTDPTTNTASSFFDQTTAQSAVSSTLQNNASQISTWLSNGGARLAVQSTLDSNVGLVVNSQGVVYQSSTVQVVLVRNTQSPTGFFILTSYPK